MHNTQQRCTKPTLFISTQCLFIQNSVQKIYKNSLSPPRIILHLFLHSTLPAKCLFSLESALQPIRARRKSHAQAKKNTTARPRNVVQGRDTRTTASRSIHASRVITEWRGVIRTKGAWMRPGNTRLSRGGEEKSARECAEERSKPHVKRVHLRCMEEKSVRARGAASRVGYVHIFARAFFSLFFFCISSPRDDSLA